MEFKQRELRFLHTHFQLSCLPAEDSGQNCITWLLVWQGCQHGVDQILALGWEWWVHLLLECKCPAFLSFHILDQNAIKKTGKQTAVGSLQWTLGSGESYPLPHCISEVLAVSVVAWSWGSFGVTAQSLNLMTISGLDRLRTGEDPLEKWAQLCFWLLLSS